MYETQNKTGKTWLAVIVKTCTCTTLAIVAFLLLYFSFETATTHWQQSLPRAVFTATVFLSLSMLMFLFLHGALKANLNDYLISARLLRMHGFQRMKRMSTEEFQRHASLQESIDQEIIVRKREMKKSAASHNAKNQSK